MPEEPQLLEPLAETMLQLDIGHEIDWWPDYLPLSAWLENIPFAFWLMKVLRPRVFVELGTHTGASYMAFCQAVLSRNFDTRCFAVDNWRGDPHSGEYDGEQLFADICAYNKEHYSGFSTLLRQNFDEARKSFSFKEIDLLHIDGYHTYEAVEHDFNNWKDCLSDKSVVLFHDISVREQDFGVWRFWQEISAQYPSFGFFHEAGIGVLGYGDNLPVPLKTLFSADKKRMNSVQSLFRSRGAAITRYYNAIIMAQHAEEWKKQYENTRHQIRRTKLFGFFPVLKTVKEGDIERRLLFNRIPIMKTLSSQTRSKHYLFNFLPIATGKVK